jgi:PAS domain S-box-containing protein
VSEVFSASESVNTENLVGILLQLTDGTIAACNPLAERILGYSTEQLIGKSTFEPPWRTIDTYGSTLLAENYPWNLALRTGQPRNNEVIGFYRPSGELVWLKLDSQPLFRDREPLPYAVVTNIVDVSDRNLNAIEPNLLESQSVRSEDKLQKTILIVEDSPEDRETYRRYLLANSECSYTIVEAELGKEGLDKYQQFHPDLIFLDYRLPDLDGLEFVTRLQRETGRSTPPVIMLTGQGNEAIASQAIKAGVFDYLVKGQLTSEELCVTASRAIENAQIRAELRRVETERQQRIEQEQLVLRIAQNIRRSLDLEEILQTTVDSVRQLLETDRVLIFRLQEDGRGTIVVESVGEGWTALLSTTLYDPCLRKTYIEPYRQGLVTTKTDIHDGNINPCHVELLEQLQVRANLVVPIVREERLWGLLIVHHCSAPRQWQQLEVNLLQQLATQVGIALQQATLYQQAQQEISERRQTAIALHQSEASARQQLAEIEAIYKTAPVGLCFIDTDLKFVRINEHLAQINGLPVSEHIGRTLRDILPEIAELFEPLYRRAIESGEPIFNLELRGTNVAQPGVARDWSISLYPQKDTDDRLLGINVTVQEITERKRAEASLRESEEFKQRMLESSRDCIKVLDLEARLLYMNPGGQCLLEIEDLTPYLNTEWLCFWQDEDRESAKAAIAAALAGEVGTFQGYFPTAKGTPKWWEVVISPILDAKGQVEQLLCISRDITDRKEAEISLKQSEQRYRYLVESIPQLVWTADANGLILDLNQRWSDYTGLTLIQVQTDGWGQLIHPDDLPNLQECWKVAQQAQSNYQAEGRMRRYDGIYRWHLHQGIPLKNERGRVVKWFGSATDIHDRVELEEKRELILKQEQRARTEAESANRIKDEFLAVLSHELRTPLNPILGWIQLLKNPQFERSRTAEALATIERNAKLQAQLIDDLLDISRIMRGKLTLNSTPVSLSEVILAAIETVRLAAKAKNIQLHLALDSNVGRVFGDAARLQQVVWNLLSNAVKFTSAGGSVTIELSRIDNDAQIQVTDTGKGINPEFLPHVFEYFRQEDGSTSRHFGGLGLGMSIARQIVEIHGGVIWVYSRGERQGATFFIRLPLFQETNISLSQFSNPVERLFDSSLLAGIKILVVDDEIDSREFLMFLLQQNGATVNSAASGLEAVRAIERNPPDLLLSDIGMPDMDGYALIRAIRSLPSQARNIPAIALTAYAGDSDRQHAISVGFQAHLPKPIDIESLLVKIIELLNREVS